MKVLFLDMDGVVNSAESFEANHVARTKEREERGEGAEFAPQFCFPFGHISEPLVARLNTIIEEVGCLIVISSAWRIGRSPKQIGEYLSVKGFKYADQIIDKTSNDSIEGRGGEIQTWLDKNPQVTQYVILDDDSLDIVGDYTTKKHPHNFVRVDYFYGLQDEQVKEAIKIFNYEKKTKSS